MAGRERDSCSRPFLGFEEVTGVGDRAMIGSFGHAFYVLKGDAMIHLNTMWVPDARVRGAELAQKIVGNL